MVIIMNVNMVMPPLVVLGTGKHNVIERSIVSRPIEILFQSFRVVVIFMMGSLRDFLLHVPTIQEAHVL